MEAVLITHEHFDHVEPERLRTAATDNPGLTVYTYPGVARHRTALGDRVRVVGDRDQVNIPGLTRRLAKQLGAIVRATTTVDAGTSWTSALPCRPTRDPTISCGQPADSPTDAMLNRPS